MDPSSGGHGEEATTVKKKKRSQGRQVIPIEPIEDKARCQVTFSKRKNGLFRKVSELSLRCDAKAAVIIFSNAGKAYALGNPSVDDVLRLVDDDYGGAPALVEAVVPGREEVEAKVRQLEETNALLAAEKLRMRAIEKKVVQAAGGKNWWEADVENLGAEELVEFGRALQRLRDNVSRHVELMSQKQ